MLDTKATKRVDSNEDIGTVDLALPATTNPEVLRQRLQATAADKDVMTVVFATYQSIDVGGSGSRSIMDAALLRWIAVGLLVAALERTRV